MPYAGGYGPPLIDWSGMSNIVQQFRQGQEYGQQNAMRSQMSGLDPNDPEYFNKAIGIMQKYRPEEAVKLYEQQQSGGDRYGLNVLWGKDAQGNDVPYQAYSGGGARRLDLGDGITAQPPVNYVQTPQGAMPRNRFGGGTPGSAEPVGPIDKDYAGPEAEKVAGETQAKAKAALPAAEESTRRIIKAIESAETNPALSRATGPIQSKLPTLSGDVADVEAQIQQAIGGTFMNVYESLRGAQAITDIEGQKATNAITRLQNMNQSDAGYMQALKDAKYEVYELLNVVRKKAGEPVQPNPYTPSESQSGDAEGWTDVGNGVRIRPKR